MPYISEDRRDEIDIPTNEYKGPGELNYTITKLVTEYVPDDVSYSDFNEVMGVLESVKQELYRRQVAPYEDTKIEQNGDVFE